MADGTGIEWTDATVNFWWGCTKVGPGCDHCYAETWSQRFGGGLWGPGAPRRKIKSAVALIHRLDNDYAWWSADCHIGQVHPNGRRRVFVQSMSDLFDTEVPIEWFDEAWGRIEACDRLEIQIVTKRISVVEKRLAAIGRTTWPQHAGLIISVVNQAEADRDIPRLIALKHKLGIQWIGLSCEPLLGGIVLRPEWLAELAWVIVGGESGREARPMHPDWARQLRDQCAEAGVSFLFKQWGEWGRDPIHEDKNYGFDRADTAACAAWTGSQWHFARDWIAMPGDLATGHGEWLFKLGKKAAGRKLDGVLHDAFPSTGANP